MIRTFKRYWKWLLHRDVKFGDIKTVRRIEGKGQVGCNGSLLHLGCWGQEKISLIEPVSVLVIGDPCTGKTAGVMVPSIVGSTDCCMLINDPKTELWKITSGYRASLGPTYKLDWTVGENNSANFNFLNSRILFPPLSQVVASETWRSSVDLIAETLISEPGCIFECNAKKALKGFLLMIVAKISDRTNQERDAGIDRQFWDKEASLPMLAKWLQDRMEEDRQARDGDEGKNCMINTIRGVIEEPGRRQFLEGTNLNISIENHLKILIDCSETDRTGILDLVAKSLQVFADATVIQRCSSSDFTPEDLRGCLTEQALCRMGRDRYPETRDDWDIVQEMVQPDDWKPVSVYLCTDLAANPHVANLTKLFFQICNKASICESSQISPFGVLMGPFPICFALDEFDKLPRIDEVFEGPSWGSFAPAVYLFSVQNYSQIENVYAEYGTSIDGTIGVRVIFRQNNEDSINRIMRAFESTQEGENLLPNENLSCMPAGEHLILVQSFMNSPISVKTPMYFQFPEFQEKTFNPRTQEGPPAAPPRPDGNRA